MSAAGRASAAPKPTDIEEYTRAMLNILEDFNLEKAGLEDPEFKGQMDRSRWPALREKLAAVIATRTRDEWCAIMEGTDICFAPVLSMT